GERGHGDHRRPGPRRYGRVAAGSPAADPQGTAIAITGGTAATRAFWERRASPRSRWPCRSRPAAPARTSVLDRPRKPSLGWAAAKPRSGSSPAASHRLTGIPPGRSRTAVGSAPIPTGYERSGPVVVVYSRSAGNGGQASCPGSIVRPRALKILPGP